MLVSYVSVLPSYITSLLHVSICVYTWILVAVYHLSFVLDQKASGTLHHTFHHGLNVSVSWIQDILQSLLCASSARHRMCICNRILRNWWLVQNIPSAELLGSSKVAEFQWKIERPEIGEIFKDRCLLYTNSLFSCCFAIWHKKRLHELGIEACLGSIKRPPQFAPFASMAII